MTTYFITRHLGAIVWAEQQGPAVILSLEETAYLMASPVNAQRLNQAIAEVEAGKAVNHALIEQSRCNNRYHRAVPLPLLNVGATPVAI